MITDPRILIALFGDLDRVVLQWTTDLATLQATVTQITRDTADCVDRIGNRITTVRQLTEDAYRAAQEAQISSENAAKSAAVAKDAAADAGTVSHATEAGAARARADWSSALDQAQSMLNTAVLNLNAAQARLRSAVNALESARSEYNAAVNDLNNCRNSYTVDKDGRRHYRSCIAEQSRVSSAQAAVEHCASAVNLAQAEVDAAKAEVTRCQAIVDHCTSGLNEAQRISAQSAANLRVAEAGLTAAQSAQAESIDARNLGELIMREAERLMEKTDRAEQLLEEMRGKLDVITDQNRLTDDAIALQSDINIRARILLLDLEDKLLQFNAVDMVEGL